jgi:Mg2+ and Co2+ transporter CorA
VPGVAEVLDGRAETMSAMDSFLITVDGSEHEISPSVVRGLLGISARFWLDLAGVDKADHVMLIYRVVDTLIDGYFPVLGDLDDRIDELEDATLQQPTDQQPGSSSSSPSSPLSSCR